MSVWTVLLAAGSGTRLAEAAGGVKKQFLRLDGRPLYWRSLRAFASLPEVAGVVVVFPPADLEEARKELETLTAKNDPGVTVAVAPGGARRQDSVAGGLAALPRECRYVLVHDAARPFADAALIGRVVDALFAGAKAVIPVLPVTDTIKEVRDGLVGRTFKRDALAAVQTPQGFDLALLRQAFAHAGEGFDVTDDASLVEHLGQPVATVPGAPENRKITHPEDLALLAASPPAALPVTGYGYDVHRYADPGRPAKQPARPMRLGGYPILGAPEVLAHSDGDVLLHALVDAILGCVAGGDIGTLFPDSNPDFDNMASGVFVSEALILARGRGLTITHVDLTVIAQIPRIAPHAQAIRLNVAALLGLDRSQVNVKATTEEGLGFTGEKKGIKAVALVTGWRRPQGPEPAETPGKA
ncbi:2-C-methyl-D-erythritol 4-phosphate cytidylyltransferase [Solidesulfovibrio sp.]|uniref:2-C-methyl-D-erythritol 4-phosphate cytidylyltransferase n=1 Tax=Solidesulfovibrio sp. TaxID=2910990 RepID=UPI0026283517|nr:2-C-methyl-D-erythritol 4-phosphate cytidylyltransferase [Solidesulfovibrio sp.]